MNEQWFDANAGYCKIHAFDLNTRDRVPLGIPESNPADSFLISAYDGSGVRHVLLDAGKKGQAASVIIPYLKANGIRTIDRLILSHPHNDHFGGMIDLLRDPALTVREFLYSPISESAMAHCDLGEPNIALWNELHELMRACGRNVTRIGESHIGSTIRINDDLGFDVIAVPDESIVQEGARVNLNNLNLVLKMKYRRFTALFPGDCGAVQAESIMRSGRYGEVKNVFLLKAAHHGGNESTTPEFVAACNPQIVIIPCNSLIAEERPAFIRNLHEFGRRGAKVYRCDHYRDIDIATDGRTVQCLGRTDTFVEHTVFRLH
ncbi:metallo-beta-lactamase [Paenibacillus sp. 32O-W]|uniref:ComEC/Rec2 family competence protein n=1 Tax=Paenibacillus sp. 32O-W TaxID=1695218 RepID=UPI00071F9B0C|nr:MBL fold metallo-hydrolase [Paenibacillus sp. 32O-W]ALS29489.1 metallo-beta-lactamase [Paenibacillus sp. 32O-W]